MLSAMQRQPLIVALLSLLSLTWLGFAWVMLAALSLFLEGSSVSDLSAAELAACAVAFPVGPIVLIGAWSFALQGHLPTPRQLMLIAKVIGALVLVIGIIVATAIAIGALKDSTAL